MISSGKRPKYYSIQFMLSLCLEQYRSIGGCGNIEVETTTANGKPSVCTVETSDVSRNKTEIIDSQFFDPPDLRQFAVVIKDLIMGS